VTTDPLFKESYEIFGFRISSEPEQGIELNPWLLINFYNFFRNIYQFRYINKTVTL
jgi:hypothetical protein